jgi:hypothetical protein
MQLVDKTYKHSRDKHERTRDTRTAESVRRRFQSCPHTDKHVHGQQSGYSLPATLNTPTRIKTRQTSASGIRNRKKPQGVQNHNHSSSPVI